MRRVSYTLSFVLSLSMWTTTSAQTQTVAIYSSGAISSDNPAPAATTANSQCPGTLTVPVPAGRHVVAVDVEYDFAATGIFWMSEQRSYLECVSTGVRESAMVFGPPVNSAGTQHYQRNGLTIANGVVPVGGLQFRLHAFRTFGTGGCASTGNLISNNTFKVTVHHIAPPTCFWPTSLAVIARTANTATVSWSTGGAANWQVEYGPPGFPTGSGTVVNTGTNPHTITGLSPSTRYEFQVRDSCGVGDVSIWSQRGSFRTQCSTVSAPWSEDFESVDWNPGTTFNTKGTIDTCYERNYYHYFVMKAGPPHFASTASGPANDHTPTGLGRYIFSERVGFGVLPDTAWILTPQISLSSLTIPELTFWYHMFGTPFSQLKLHVSNDFGASYTQHFVKTGNQQSAATDPWHEAIIDLSAYTGDTVVLKFEVIQSTSSFFGNVAVDDISVHEQPTCPRPMGLTAVSATSSTVTLGWTPGSSSSKIEYGIFGFTKGTGTVVSVSTNPFTVTGLLPNTTYTFYLQDSCSANDLSVWSFPFSYKTLCGPVSAPYFENFDGPGWDRGTFMNDFGSINACWSRDMHRYAFKPGPWTFVQTNTGAAVDHTTGSSAGRFIKSDMLQFLSGALDTAVITSEAIDLSTLTIPEMSFWYHMFGVDIDALKVLISNDGVQFDLVATITGMHQSSNNDPWKELIVDISAYTGDTIQVRFVSSYLNFASSADICIDDLSIHEQPACPKPQNLTIINSYHNSITLSWLGGGAGNWNIEYGAPGFPAGTGTRVNAASNPFTVTGLTPNTPYEFRVRDSCGVGVVSVWSVVAAGRTACTPVSAPYFENFDGPGFGISPTLTASGFLDPCWLRDDMLNFQWTAETTVINSTSGPNSDHTGSGGKFMYTERIFGTNFQPSMFAPLTSPWIDLSTLNVPELRFWYHMFGLNIDSLVVEVIDSTGVTRVAALIGEQQTGKSDKWKKAVVDISAFANSTIRVRFTGYRDSDFGFRNAIAIDDLWILEQPTCPEPVNVVVTNTTQTSVTLSWTSGGASNWNIRYRDLSIGGPWTYLPVSAIPATITGLNPSSTYAVEVRDSCGIGDVSLWTETSNVSTLCGVATAPWSENFDGPAWVPGVGFTNFLDEISQCWSRPGTSGPHFGTREGSTGSFGTGPSSDVTTFGKYIYTEANNGVGTGQITTPFIYIPPGLSNPRLKFAYHMFGANISSFVVRINEGNGFVGGNAFVLTGQQQTSETDAWKWDSISLTPYLGDTIQFRFYAANSGFSADIALDDISIVGDACPPLVPAFTHTNNWLDVQFDATATLNADSVQWDFGDSFQGSGLTPLHSYATPGRYPVTLTAYSSCGAMNVWTDTVDVCDTLAASISYTVTADSIFVDGSGSLNATSFHWDFGGEHSATGQSAGYRFASTGFMNIVLTVTNICGDTVTDSVEVGVCLPPVAHWTGAIVDTALLGMAVQFDGSASQNAVTYEWDFGDGSPLVTGQVKPLHIYTFPNMAYDVKLRVGNDCGDKNAMVKKLLTVGTDEWLTRNFKVYPNPAKHQINLEWSSTRMPVNRIDMIDITGRVVQHLNTTDDLDGAAMLDVSDLPAGLYLVRLITQGDMFEARIVVE